MQPRMPQHKQLPDVPHMLVSCRNEGARLTPACQPGPKHGIGSMLGPPAGAKTLHKSQACSCIAYTTARLALQHQTYHVAAGVVEDLGTGEYRAAFCATAAGVYVVAVQLGSRNIAGSPFAAAVAPAGVCAATSAVALAPAALVAGQQARV